MQIAGLDNSRHRQTFVFFYFVRCEKARVRQFRLSHTLPTTATIAPSFSCLYKKKKKKQKRNCSFLFLLLCIISHENYSYSCVLFIFNGCECQSILMVYATDVVVVVDNNRTTCRAYKMLFLELHVGSTQHVMCVCARECISNVFVSLDNGNVYLYNAPPALRGHDELVCKCSE